MISFRGQITTEPLPDWSTLLLRGFNRDLTKLRRRGQRERLKQNSFYEQNNNTLFVQFFAVPAQLRLEITKL